MTHSNGARRSMTFKAVCERFKRETGRDMDSAPIVWLCMQPYRREDGELGWAIRVAENNADGTVNLTNVATFDANESNAAWLAGMMIERRIRRPFYPARREQYDSNRRPVLTGMEN